MTATREEVLPRDGRGFLVFCGWFCTNVHASWFEMCQCHLCSSFCIRTSVCVLVKHHSCHETPLIFHLGHLFTHPSHPPCVCGHTLRQWSGQRMRKGISPLRLSAITHSHFIGICLSSVVARVLNLNLSVCVDWDLTQKCSVEAENIFFLNFYLYILYSHWISLGLDIYSLQCLIDIFHRINSTLI